MLRPMNKHSVAPCPTIYVVDADPSVRAALPGLFATLSTAVRTYASAEAFLSDVSADARGCLIVELNLPGMDGLELMEQLRQRGINLPVIMLASASDVPAAVSAMQRGALDFIDKPFVDRVLFSRVRQILTMAQNSSVSKPMADSDNLVGYGTRATGAPHRALRRYHSLRS